jgi:hypothetical protein
MKKQLKCVDCVWFYKDSNHCKDFGDCRKYPPQLVQRGGYSYDMTHETAYPVVISHSGFCSLSEPKDIFSRLKPKKAAKNAKS